MRFLLILIILSLPWILFYNFNTAYYWDEAVYLNLAGNIQHGEYFINIEPKESFRAPLFPFILYLFYPFGEYFLKLLPIIFMFLSAVIIYYFISKFYNEKIAFYLISFLLTSPLLLFFGERILNETLFLLLFSSSLILFYISIEKNKIYLPLTGFLLGISFLTKYQGIYLIPILFIYTLLRKKNSILKSKEFILAVIIFTILLVPWMLNSYKYYGDPLGSYKAQMESITDLVSEKYYSGPVYFYIMNAIAIFGLPIILFPVFFNKKFFNNKFNKIIIISVMIIFLIFSFSLRKEIRYLASFSFIFLLPSAIGLYNLERKIRMKALIPMVFTILIASNIFLSVNLMTNGKNSGINIKNAAEFLKDKVSENDYVIANNYPVVNYITKARVIIFPDKDLDLTLEKYKIKYIIVDFSEVTLPDYVKGFDEKYKKIMEFGDGWDKVIIYQA